MPGAPQKGKPSVSARAQQFLASIGTAGGPIGAPGLFTFGAGNLREQVAASQMNPYYVTQQTAAAQAPIIGAPNASNLAPNIGTTTMPRDFDSGYLHLNVPGSPLPQYGLMTAHNAKAAQITQDQARALQQHSIMPFMPMTGQLPVDPAMMQQPLVPQKGGR
jgi:hypothetical protein